MTDPERISKRGSGLGAQLLQASVSEQPSDVSLLRTLAALGVSGAVLTTTSAAGAAASAGGAVTGAASAGTVVSTSAGKLVGASLLMKWVGVGIVGGVSLAGAATLVTSPAAAPPPIAARPPSARSIAPSAGRARVAPLSAASASVEPPEAATTSPPIAHLGSSQREPAAPPPPDVGAPLAAEVAFVDRARGLLAGGRTEAGLAELARYERAFPEARLLPEVLFLQLETYQRLGRASDARRVAARLASQYPKSPHAARARSLLGAEFP